MRVSLRHPFLIMEVQMTRREIREQIFHMLFRLNFYPEDQVAEQEELFLDGLRQNVMHASFEADEESLLYIQNKVHRVMEHLEEIDAKINDMTTGWKTSRMAKVDLTIIRLGVYEILYDDDIPGRVAVNEAVTLAKKYGTDDSTSFVNGVLAKVL